MQCCFFFAFLSAVLRPNILPFMLRFLSSSVSSYYPNNFGRWLCGERCYRVHWLLSSVLQYLVELTGKISSSLTFSWSYSYFSMLYSVYQITEYHVLCLVLWLLCAKPVFPNLHLSSRMSLIKERKKSTLFILVLYFYPVYFVTST